jgi:hypothetical protein
MKRQNEVSGWTPDKRGASLLIVVFTNLLLIFLKSVGAVVLDGGMWWIGFAIGCALAAALNWLRARYNQAGRFWKPIYRFLLEQMPPPD